jgi:hypothetical protein
MGGLIIGKPGSNPTASQYGTTARERIVEIAKIGRIASHAPGPKARRAQTQRQHTITRLAWQRSSLPAWLNEETYTRKIQPLLTGVANPVIRSTLGGSVTYAVAIRAGRRRPHPRHWEALARLAGISEVKADPERKLELGCQ